MRTHGPFNWTIDIAASMICILVTIAPVSAKSKINDQDTAVSGTVTGNVQEVGFRAMIQKQAIQYNLSGSAENNTDGSVRFTLQGDNDRIKQALKSPGLRDRGFLSLFVYRPGTEPGGNCGVGQLVMIQASSP